MSTPRASLKDLIQRLRDKADLERVEPDSTADDLPYVTWGELMDYGALMQEAADVLTLLDAEPEQGWQAFKAGFQWALSGTNGDYNGGPPEDGFRRFMADQPQQLWQEIETAPVAGGVVYIGAHINEHGVNVVQLCSGDWSKSLTHWMPLPAPPRPSSPAAPGEK
jgi:hypothetical protein